MISSAECHAKVLDMEKRAREGPDHLREEWTAMADHWRGLQESALRQEGVTLSDGHPHCRP